MTASFRGRIRTVAHRYDTNRALLTDDQRSDLNQEKPPRPRTARTRGPTDRHLSALHEPPRVRQYTRLSPSDAQPSSSTGTPQCRRQSVRAGQLMVASAGPPVVAVALGFEPRVAMNHVVAGGCSTVSNFRFSALSQRFCYGEALGNCEILARVVGNMWARSMLLAWTRRSGLPPESLWP